ncbi:hypothetical protein ILUMI_06943 [Ignelater luminosus]|uniref:Uncharacterized protein n=1 Tax=Ignelater luminosus TaxID=2038154 RepID=A0A8K0D8B3_IGNLU|nr:hypothetical protein ILUMI_06943 [Ignelater luminosus]
MPEVQMVDQTVRQKLHNELQASPQKNHTSIRNKDKSGDKTQISIFGSNSMKCIHQQPGKGLLPKCTMATMKHLISVMIGACMLQHGVTQWVEGSITTKKYQVLEAKLSTICLKVNLRSEYFSKMVHLLYC